MKRSDSEGTLRSLSVKHPWAQLIADGAKRVENRSQVNRSALGIPVCIHASLRWDTRVGDVSRRGEAYEAARFIDRGACVFGAVIAVVHFVHSVTESSDPFYFGPHGWVIGRRYKLPDPVPCGGALSLWRLPHGADLLVRRQLADSFLYDENPERDRGTPALPRRRLDPEGRPEE